MLYRQSEMLPFDQALFGMRYSVQRNAQLTLTFRKLSWLLNVRMSKITTPTKSRPKIAKKIVPKSSAFSASV